MEYLNLGPADFDSSEIFGLELAFHCVAYRHIRVGENILRAAEHDPAERGDMFSDYAAKVNALRCAMADLHAMQDEIAASRAVAELANGSSQSSCTDEME